MLGNVVRLQILLTFICEVLSCFIRNAGNGVLGPFVTSCDGVTEPWKREAMRDYFNRLNILLLWFETKLTRVVFRSSITSERRSYELQKKQVFLKNLVQPSIEILVIYTNSSTRRMWTIILVANWWNSPQAKLSRNKLMKQEKAFFFLYKVIFVEPRR